jgi:glycosyltransferase involved in cell wall biosynthesis
LKILIDIQSLQTKQSRFGGVGRYTYNIVSSLLIHHPRNEYILAINASLPEKEKLRSEFKSQATVVEWINHAFTCSGIQERNFQSGFSVVDAGELLREEFFNSFYPDIIFSPNLQEGFHDNAVTSVKKTTSSAAYITTLHDIIPLEYEIQYLRNQPARAAYFRKISDALKSDLLLTVSEYTKNEITQKLKVSPKVIEVVPNAVDRSFFNAAKESDSIAEDLLARYGIDHPYLLYVGGGDKHKNLEFLISTFVEYIQQKNNCDLILVMVGKDLASNETLSRTISESGISTRVVLPGYVVDDDLRTIYQHCSCFVFPSTHEGFGIPVLEAMSCGAPVITSDYGAIMEVIGNKEYTFPPHDSKRLYDLLDRVLTDQLFRKNLKSYSAKRSAEFSWQNSALALNGLFNKFVSAKREKKPIRFIPDLERYVRVISDLNPRIPEEAYHLLLQSYKETFRL